MPVVNKSVKINASVRKVFNFVTEPDNWTRYVTSLTSVKDRRKGLPETGGTFSWEYKMFGFKFAGKGKVTDFTKNKSFGLALAGKVTINESYRFTSNDDGTTTLKVRIDYEIPSKAAEFLMGTKLGEKLNGLESKHVLENIKTMCEA
jgi:uncharacterized membrane protein